MPTDIKYYQQFGGEKVIFEKEEKTEMKKFGEPGVCVCVVCGVCVCGVCVVCVCVCVVCVCVCVCGVCVVCVVWCVCGVCGVCVVCVCVCVLSLPFLEVWLMPESPL